LYARPCLRLARDRRVHALSHVTGGGLAANLARVLPAGVTVTVDRGTWAPAPIFGLVADVGSVHRADLERTLNMGVGMVAVAASGQVDAVVESLRADGVTSWVIGEVIAGDAGEPGAVALTGTHR
jgi:phosphoribosylformylglycinamidine cyclo-ligase